jgi:hypothetical protein
MANNYQDMTGVLVLKKVTPVIKALFGGFKLDENYPGNGQAYIASMSEGGLCSWDSVLENLQELAQQFGHITKSEQSEPTETVEQVLSLLAGHFNAHNNIELENLIEHGDFSQDVAVNLDSLFSIAKAFDDGHGLRACKTETAWHCSKPLLFEFGGCGNFAGSHVSVSRSSHQVVSFGEDLETAISSGNTDAAAECIRTEVGRLLAGIHDEAAREQVRCKIGQLIFA